MENGDLNIFCIIVAKLGKAPLSIKVTIYSVIAWQTSIQIPGSDQDSMGHNLKTRHEGSRKRRSNLRRKICTIKSRRPFHMHVSHDHTHCGNTTDDFLNWSKSDILERMGIGENVDGAPPASLELYGILGMLSRS